jgi:cell division protein FtsB
MIALFGLSVMFGINGMVNYARASRRKAKLYKESVPLTPLS